VSVDFIGFLRNCGAQLSENAGGYTTLAWALRNFVSDEVTTYPLEEGCQYSDSPSGEPLHCLLNPILVYSRKQISEHLVMHILNAGVDINGTDSQGRTPLHYLLGKVDNLRRDNILRILRLFLHQGASVSQLDNYGYSVLDYAACTLPVAKIRPVPEAKCWRTSPEGKNIELPPRLGYTIESRILEILIQHVSRLAETPEHCHLVRSAAFQDILNLRIHGLHKAVKTMVTYAGFAGFVDGTDDSRRWTWLARLDQDHIEPLQKAYCMEIDIWDMMNFTGFRGEGTPSEEFLLSDCLHLLLEDEEVENC
jgi:hypothetical protein